MRLDKMLVHLGLGSRKDVQKLIKVGRVQLEGRGLMRDAAAQVEPETPLVVDGERMCLHKRHDIMLHKPQGVITATRDPRQETVMDLLPARYRACGAAPVGRLDKDVSGLIIITDDGVMAHRLLSPKKQVGKVYVATVEGELLPAMVEAFASGLELDDGMAQPAHLEILSPTQARVTVFEGRFHQVKRMFAAVGTKVAALRREAFGGLYLDESLAPGAFRPLEAGELEVLMRACEDGWMP